MDEVGAGRIEAPVLMPVTRCRREKAIIGVDTVSGVQENLHRTSAPGRPHEEISRALKLV